MDVYQNSLMPAIPTPKLPSPTTVFPPVYRGEHVIIHITKTYSL